MLGRSIGSPSLEENDDSGISRMSGKQSGFRVRLPSPFMLAIVVVFVVLPLVWPDNGDETSNPKPIAAFELVADVKSLDISQDGRKVAATCRDSPIDVWMREQPLVWRRTLLPEHRLAGSRCLAFSPDGKTLAVGNVDGTVSLWDMDSGNDGGKSRCGKRHGFRTGLLTRWHPPGYGERGFTRPFVGRCRASFADLMGRSSRPGHRAGVFSRWPTRGLRR